MESLSQQLFAFLGTDRNASTPLNTQQPLELTPSSFFSLLIAFPALRNWLKLIVIGGVLESCRQFYYSIWSYIVNSFFISAQFKEDDSSFDWMMVWLSRQPSWSTYLHA